MWHTLIGQCYITLWYTSAIRKKQSEGEFENFYLST